MKKKPGLIRTIYFYFFSAVGLILLIVGIFNLSQFVVKRTLLPKYDLGYDETRCNYSVPQTTDGKTNKQDLEKQKADCLKQLEEDRQSRQVLDLSSSITFIIVGSIVFMFHFRRTKSLDS